jgi:hypothetical protein
VPVEFLVAVMTLFLVTTAGEAGVIYFAPVVFEGQEMSRLRVIVICYNPNLGPSCRKFSGNNLLNPRSSQCIDSGESGVCATSKAANGGAKYHSSFEVLHGDS